MLPVLHFARITSPAAGIAQRATSKPMIVEVEHPNSGNPKRLRPISGVAGDVGRSAQSLHDHLSKPGAEFHHGGKIYRQYLPAAKKARKEKKPAGQTPFGPGR